VGWISRGGLRCLCAKARGPWRKALSSPGSSGRCRPRRFSLSYLPCTVEVTFQRPPMGTKPVPLQSSPACQPVKIHPGPVSSCQRRVEVMPRPPSKSRPNRPGHLHSMSLQSCLRCVTPPHLTSPSTNLALSISTATPISSVTTAYRVRLLYRTTCPAGVQEAQDPGDQSSLSTCMGWVI
jgi:hypothetical protein